MIAKKTTLLWAVFGASLLAARASAQPEPEPAGEAPPAAAAPGAEAGDDLTLPKGRLVLNAFLEINLSTDAVGKPISLSPDVWYGVTPEITAGLVHSAVGRSGFIGFTGGTGSALCLTGSDNGCADFYPGFGLEARYKLKTGMFSWAAEGGLMFNHLSDPLRFGLKLGAVGRWHSGQIALELEPSLYIGITNRSQDVLGMSVAFNRDVLGIPATVLYAIDPKISVSGQLGIVLPLEDAGDTYSVPLSIGGHYHVNESLTATLAFSLARLIGGGSGTGFDTRVLTLGGTYAF